MRLAWGPDLDPSWLSPRGQRPRSNGFCGSRVGLLGTKFQFAAERLLGRGRRGPGELGLRGTPRGTGLGVGEVGLAWAPGGRCSIKTPKPRTTHCGRGIGRVCFPPAPPAWTLKGAALFTRIRMSAHAAMRRGEGRKKKV